MRTENALRSAIGGNPFWPSSSITPLFDDHQRAQFDALARRRGFVRVRHFERAVRGELRPAVIEAEVAAVVT